MAKTYFLLRNDELAVVEESVYGTSPGDPVAADFFKSESSRVDFKQEAEKFERDSDRDYGQASVTEMHVGRRKTSYTLKGRCIPSGNASTPTAPDATVYYKAAFGSVHTATAHTTTTAASAGTTLKLTAGGGAASGVAVGDLIAVDVDATYGIEVRRVTAIATDDLTIDRAFSADPATGRAVYVGTTYKLSEAALISFHQWLFNGDNMRYKVPGCIVNELGLTINLADGAPTMEVTFKGEGQPRAAQTVSKPTATTAGSVEVPDVGRAWIGSTLVPLVTANLSVKNGVKLRSREGDALYPTGLNRLDNKSRYMVDQTLEFYYTEGDRDLSSIESGADTLSALDVLVQIGNAVGKIVAWNTPNWQPEKEDGDQDGEVGLKLTGRCYGTNGDDEVYLAFI